MKKIVMMAALAFSALLAQASVTLNMAEGILYKHDGSTPLSLDSTMLLLCDADGDGFGGLTNDTSWTTDSGDVVLARWGFNDYAGPNIGSDAIMFDLASGVGTGDNLMLVWYDKIYNAADTGAGKGVYFGAFRTDSTISFSDTGWIVPGDGAGINLNFLTANAGGDSLESAGVASLQTIPEPTTAVLALIGGGLAYMVRRKQNIWAN